MFRSYALGVVLLAVACSPADLGDPLDDDPVAFIEDAAYRRGILERDLVSVENAYAQRRLANYGLDRDGWDVLPALDRATLPVTPAVVEAVAAGEPPAFDHASATTLVPDRLPATKEEWVELGRRVFFEYAMRPELIVKRAVELDELDEIGLMLVDGEYVGLRMFEVDGELAFGTTCAACHAGRDAGGEVSGALASRTFDVGHMRLLDILDHNNEIPPVFDSTELENLAQLGPGRSDVLEDGEFNPYAFPDWGGIADVPYLHHTANWHHRGTATMAVRIETVFMTGDDEQSRIPRVLAWGFAEYVRSLPPPAPAEPGDGPEVERGREMFEAAGCDGCHVPPLYTSDRLVGVDEIGTDPSAGRSPIRATGYYRIPSLRGVGRTAPYLHHGAFQTLEEMFDPGRDEAGHPFGLGFDAVDRAALIRFLRSI